MHDLYGSSDRIDGPSTVDQETKTWNKIHSLPVRPNIRIFLWRAAQNILPTGTNLLRRGISENLDGVHCGYQIEDDRHPLFDYLCKKKFGTIYF